MHTYTYTHTYAKISLQNVFFRTHGTAKHINHVKHDIENFDGILPLPNGSRVIEIKTSSNDFLQIRYVNFFFDAFSNELVVYRRKIEGSKN